jgi:hypothetical protein
MRPRTLDEYVGQAHIVGPGRLLRRAIEADQLSSVIFYGPPGTGKTTLARVIANTTRAHFIAINAVLAGVKDIREAIDEAQERARLHNQRTILFVDEVHRFNKAQQDALLPWVENGTVIFIGATTENPYFEVNKALVSRSRIFQLVPLTQDDLRAIVQQTLADPERGYGGLEITIDADALDHLVEVANGDARAVLNALELAVETTGTEKKGDWRGGDKELGARKSARRWGAVSPISLSPSLPLSPHHPRHCRGVDPAPRRALRQGGRLSLRHDQRLYQEPARQRPRRGDVLDGEDGLCRRGAALHLPADADLCRRGCGHGRPATRSRW